MGTLYRVEKDGRSFYVPEELVEAYAQMGYAVYRTVEERVEFGKEVKDEG